MVMSISQQAANALCDQLFAALHNDASLLAHRIQPQRFRSPPSGWLAVIGE